MADYLQLARERAAGAPPADASNPYLAIAQDEQKAQQGRARFVIEQALKGNPELAAERQRLSQTSGLPLSIVERNLEEVRRKEAAAAIDLARMAEESPVLARQLVDPTFTSVAVDDLSTLETVGKFVGDLGGAMKSGVFRASRGAAGTFQAGFELLAPALDFLEPVTAVGGNPLRRLAEGFAMQGAAAGQTAEAAMPRTDSILSSGFYSGIQSLTQNLMTLPLAFAPGGQGAALAGMTAFTGGDAYQQAREKGLPMSQALPFAASQAAIEYATEKLPLAALLKDVKVGAGFMQILGRQIALEVPGEQLATVLQDLNEWAVLNPGRPFSAYLEERPSAAAQTLVATIVGTGGNVAVVKGLETLISRAVSDGANMQQAGLAAQALEQAMRGAEASLLRERSPDQFRSLMSQMSQDGSLYVDAAVLNQMPPEILQRLPGVVQALPEALLANAPVEVKLADALTVLPGTPEAQVFMQNARTAPDAPTLIEAEEAGKQAQEFLQQEAARVIEQAADQEALRQSQEAVKANVKQQLAATGRFRDAVNEGYATWAAAFYTAYGSRLGMTPEEFYQRYPLRVLGAPVGQQTGVLNAPGRELDRDGIPVATMAEVQAVADIPTVEKMAQAMDLLGEAEFERRVQARMRSLSATTPEQQAMVTESVAINAVAINRADARQGGTLEQAAVERLQMVAERGVRATASRSIISAEERAAIQASAPAINMSVAELEAIVRNHKLAHPVAQGWEPLVYVRSVLKDGKPLHQYQNSPYTFSAGTDGKQLEPGTANYTRRVNAVARSMVDEVRTVFRRAANGDRNAQNILAQAGWYKAMRSRLRHEFGGLGDLFADLLGATSPNTPVRDNWFNAVDALRRASRGDFDPLILQWEAWADNLDTLETDLRAWFNERMAEGLSKKAIKELPEYQTKLAAVRAAREIPDSLLPTKESGSKYGFNGKNVIRAMVDLWRIVKNADPDIARGGTAPKALNFSGNLIGFRSRATIDVWAARMLQRLAGGRRIASMAETGVSGDMREDATTTLQFGFGQDVFGTAARAIRNDPELQTDAVLAEINDDDLQAVVWFVEKEIWTVNDWTSAAGEGGSFELEANLTGTSQQDRVKELRTIIDASPPTADVTAASQDTTAALKAIEDHERQYAAEIEELRKLTTGEIAPYKGSKKRMDELGKLVRPPAEATRLLGSVDRAKARLEAFNARKVAAKAELAALEREVDRFVGGLSIQMSKETQGVDFVPTDADMARLAEEIRRSVYEADDGNTVLASKALSTEGRYGGVERSLDLEVVAREGYNANALWLQMLRQAQAAKQDSTFLSRVLRANEEVDPLRHRPGVEIYFQSAAAQAQLEKMLAELAKEGVEFLTVIVDGRRLAGTMGGQMPAAVGVRLQYVPEFEQRYGMDDFGGLDDAAIADKINQRAAELDRLAARVSASVEGVSFAGQFWYDTQVAFSHEYQEKIDALTTGTAEGEAAQAGGGVWVGQPIRAGLESADRQSRETAGGEPGGDVLGGDAQRAGVLEQQPLTQGPRGTFNPQTLELVLNPNADLSTWFHETGHFFLEVLADVASRPDAPAQVVEDYNKVLAWFGVTPEQWAGFSLDQKRPYHERWAESIEQYVIEGKAPSVELQPVMRRFRAWLTSVYQSLKAFVTGKPELELNDDIRRVMDRMLATDEQIAQANEVAGFMPDEQADGEAAERLQKRSMADLKWAVKARDKVIAKLKRQAREVEKALREQVTAEVEQRPEVLAKAAIAQAEKQFEKDPVAGDMNIAAIADSFGFPSVDAMYRAIDLFGNKKDAIDGIVERRMLEENGDLIDERAIQEAANEAVHNEARARSLATELRTQQEMLGGRTDTGRVNTRGAKITVNTLVEAAKQFGANVVARTPLKDLRATAWKHTAAERRAGKRWAEATAKGDTAAAVQAKQDQVLNNAAAKAALEAADQAKKTLEFFARVTKGNDEKIVEKGRDPDIVNAARAVLAAYGVQTPASKTAAAYLEAVQKNDPETYAAIEPMVTAATQNAQPLEALTFEELQGLGESVQAMWHLAKRSRQMEVDGDLMDIDEAADQLFAKMEEIGIPDTVPGETGALTRAELLARQWLQAGPALLRRVEQWAEAKDGTFGGPFLRLIFQPVKDAADRYRTDRLAYRRKFQALVDAIAPTMKPGLVEAPELGYTFGRGHNGIGMAELLHAVLHTGNDSNKRKLLLGRGWATENADGTLDTSRWDAFLTRLHDTGVLTKAHWDFAQGVWDLMEETKPLAQKTHRDVFGRYFEEITANPVETPFGTYRGGYVPAQADPLLVQDADLRELLETENAGMSYAFPQTNRGFTKGRVEYNRPLKLDLRTLPQHIDKVLLFSHMEPAVRGAARLLRRPKVSQPLGRIDPTAISGVLRPWLNRAARQTVETPISADAGLNRMASAIRGRVGMALMFANVSNTLQQITGLLSANIKVPAADMMRAAASYIANPKKLKDSVWTLSPYMADRASNEVAVLSDTLDAILINPSTYERAEAFTRQHGYFLQTFFDNQLSPIIWTGAYNQALREGMDERMAIRYADGIIRQTQGSTLPEDVSRIETGPAYARLFTQFIGYFNMVANTNATALQQIAREQGLKKGAGKAFYVLMMGLMLPIWMAEAIALAFRGGPEDEDDDGYLDDWMAAVFGFGTIKGVLAGVPFIGALGQSAIERFNDNPMDDRLSVSPTISILESAAGAPASVYKAIVDDASAQKAVRDAAALITVTTGLPAMTLARPVGYAAGVAQGRIEPTSAADAARGVITGTASPESKAR